MTIGSLFSGIGGLEMGLEWAGHGPVIWQAESDEFASQILERSWPDVLRYRDVCAIDERARTPKIICGGFPCTDISSAGRRAGLEGASSSLWWEFARIIRLLRPEYVVVENVPDLTARGLDAILGELASCGYDAEWDCISAAAVGAPHRRERLFIIASLADPNSAGPQGTHREGPTQRNAPRPDWWRSEPDVGRVASGIPHRVDRIRCLGNAVIPQVAFVIGERLTELMKARAFVAVGRTP